MRERKTKIDEFTLIPISLLITICGGIYWISGVSHRTEANAKEIIQVREDHATLLETVTVQREALARIEGKLETLPPEKLREIYK